MFIKKIIMDREVYIKSWDDMCNEFGYNKSGINTPNFLFIKEMEDKLPMDRCIKVYKEEGTNYWIWIVNNNKYKITEDMISDKYISDKYSDVVDKLNEQTKEFFESIKNYKNCNVEKFVDELIFLGCDDLYDLSLINRYSFKSLSDVVNAKLYIFLNKI